MFKYVLLGLIFGQVGSVLALCIRKLCIEIDNKLLFKKILKNLEKELNKNA